MKKIKIYVLDHTRTLDCGHECGKAIGTFFSKEKAEEVLKEYKKMRGFKDYPNDFTITEYVVDELHEASYEKLMKNRDKYIKK